MGSFQLLGCRWLMLIHPPTKAHPLMTSLTADQLNYTIMDSLSVHEYIKLSTPVIHSRTKAHHLLTGSEMLWQR